MYDERQLKGELSKLFAILASCINYQLVPGASIVEQCWATVIIITQVRLGARACLGFTRATGEERRG